MAGSAEWQKVFSLLDDMPIAMLSTFAAGHARSVPMARQEIEPSAEMWFITARSTEHVRALQFESAVLLTFSSSSAWVALTGHATIVDDQAKLEELWNTFAEAWLPEGPGDSNATLIRVDIEHAEYWDTPGGRVASVVSLAKSKLTGDTYDAEHGEVETR